MRDVLDHRLGAGGEFRPHASALRATGNPPTRDLQSENAIHLNPNALVSWSTTGGRSRWNGRECEITSHSRQGGGELIRVLFRPPRDPRKGTLAGAPVIRNVPIFSFATRSGDGHGSSFVRSIEFG